MEVVVTFKGQSNEEFPNLHSLHHALFLATVLWSYAQSTLVMQSTAVNKVLCGVRSSTCAWGNMFASSSMKTHPGLSCSCKHTCRCTCQVWVTQSRQGQKREWAHLLLHAHSHNSTFLITLCLPTSPTCHFHHVCVCALIFPHEQEWVLDGFLFYLWPGKEVGHGVRVCYWELENKAASVRNRRGTRSVRTLPEKQLRMSEQAAQIPILIPESCTHTCTLKPYCNTR